MNQALPEKGQTPDNREIDHVALNEIRSGLMSSPKRISSKYFYDECGSGLFEQITHLSEYYLTRAEASILNRFADEIAEVAGRGKVLLEPGAGNCTKVRHLLRALRPACYAPTDISRDYLLAAADKLQQQFPEIPVYPDANDMQSAPCLPQEFSDFPRLVFFPGSTIGNCTPERAVDFLRHIRKTIGKSGGLLIGVDLQKDRGILHRAYNDAAGITARFNLNILNHINTLTGIDFDLSKFRHLAFYNDQEGRIEMHLESLCDQLISVGADLIPLAEAERILTEYSYKYTLHGFAELASRAGLTVERYWTDEDEMFSLQYCTSTRSS